MRARHNHGFTLLEMLVVLALMALATGVVVPRASGWLDSVQERGWRADLRAHLESMPVRAFLSGEQKTLDAEAILAAVPDGPAGLRLTLPAPLQYSPIGVASGGRLQLVRGGARETWTVEPITGRVTEGS